MAGLFGSAITAICLSAASGTYNDACNHAMDAGARQAGLRQQIDHAEDKTTEIVGQKVMYNTEKIAGKEAVLVIALGGYAYRVVKDKALNLKLPTLGLCSSANNQITQNSYKLVLEWKW